MSAKADSASERAVLPARNNAPDGSHDIKRKISELPANEAQAVGRRRVDIIEAGDRLGDHKPDGRSYREYNRGDRARDGLHDRLAHSPAPRPFLLAALMRFLLFALALQPAIMAFPVGRDLRGLNLEPALMIVEIFIGRDEHLAGPDHGLLDDGDGFLERGDGLRVGILLTRRPWALLTHRTDHAERLP